MLLAIDVGNTNMVFGIYDGDELIRSFRLMTDIKRTSDEIGLLVYTYLTKFEIPTAQIEDVIIASVVPQVMYSLTSGIIKYFNKTPYIVGETIPARLPFIEESEEKLGADRIVACIGAMQKYGLPLIVLDFGTATTIDVLNSDGVYCGGCIMPGIQISTDALFHHTSTLPHIEIAIPPSVLGRSTTAQMQAGAVMGYVGSVEYLVKKCKEEMGPEQPVHVVATGGLGRLISENTDQIDSYDSQLILDGLLYLYQKRK